MAQRDSSDLVPVGGHGLPRRDWVLLPFIGILTISILAASTELIARFAFPSTAASPLDCLILDDPTTGVRAIPNTVCRSKAGETELIEYRFNSCGHRAGMECGPKSAGTYRIVMVGSSFGEGIGVRVDQTYASLLPRLLSQRTGRKIELYNEAVQLGSPRTIDIQFEKALAAQPDLVLWTLTPWEFDNVDLATFVPRQAAAK